MKKILTLKEGITFLPYVQGRKYTESEVPACYRYRFNEHIEAEKTGSEEPAENKKTDQGFTRKGFKMPDIF